jgi:hypothetical protein
MFVAIIYESAIRKDTSTLKFTFMFKHCIRPGMILSIVLLSCLGCGNRTGLTSNSSAPFLITNASGVGWMIQYTNGVCVSFGSNDVAITFQIDSSLTAGYDQSTKAIKNIVLERAPEGNDPGEWVALNADGIPYQRSIKGRHGGELFYHGNWFPAVPLGGGKTKIKINGQDVVLHFEGRNWKESP